MSPVSKPEGTSTTKKSLSSAGPKKKSKSLSQESQNPTVGSPSSKSYSSGRTSERGPRGNRRRRSSPNSKSALRETLSSFGDDVIKVKNYPKLYGYDNHGYFHQPDVSFDTELGDIHGKDNIGELENDASRLSKNARHKDKGLVENELATIMSSHQNHDPNFQTKHFERVDPSEVRVRSSGWQKLFQASASSRRFQKFKRSDGQKGRSDIDWSTDELFCNNDGRIELDPPFWGVSRRTREKIPMLGLSLILHELACFTSCVLLGSTIFQGMEAISWVHQKPFIENQIFFKWYSSFQTLLVVITCVGFLNRVDTTERRSLWLLPIFLIPVLSLSASDYCNKAWELQRLECINFHRLSKSAQQKVHLSQDCSLVENAVKVLAFPSSISIKSAPSGVIKTKMERVTAFNVPSTPTTGNQSITELGTRTAAPLVMRLISAFSTLIISSYLFCCRKTYFLIDLFGPPEELKGNIKNFVMLGVYDENDNQDKMEILYHHRKGVQP